MKFLFIILIILMAASSSARAQSLERAASLTYDNLSLGLVLSDLSLRYGLKFSYSHNVIPLDQKIKITVSNVTLEEGLKRIFESAGIQFEVSGDQIVLRPTANSSSPMIVTGKVVDATTNAPLPFASISLDQTALGTATNNEGEFTLNIPEKYETGKITISFIGYKNHNVDLPVRSADPVFKLKEETTVLDAVTITSKSGLSILEEAISRIQQNYDTGEVKYTYFIRDLVKQDGEPIGAGETIYEAYKSSDFSRRQIAAIKGRRTKEFGAVQNILQTFIRWTGFEMGINTSIIFSIDLSANNSEDEFPSKNFLRHHTFELLGASRLDDKEVYVISFDQKDNYGNKSLYKGKFFIDTESLAFSRIEMGLSPKGIKHAKFLGTSKAVASLFGFGRCSILAANTVTNYKPWNGKWYPSSAKVEWISRLIKPRTQFASDVQLTGYVAITDIKTNQIRPLDADKVLSSRNQRNWEYHYKLKFWEGDNTIATDPEMENAFQTIAQRNKKNGIDMRFWKRYQPYKNDPALLVRDSLHCQQVFHNDMGPRGEDLKDATSHKILRPKYPALDRTVHSSHFVVHYTEKDSAHARDVSAILEKNYPRILSDFEVSGLPEGVHIELYPDIENYHFAIGEPDSPESDVGRAISSSLFKMVSPGNPGTYHTRESLLKAAVHEFTHCVHYYFIDQLSEADQNKINDDAEAFWLFESIASYEAQQFYHPSNFEYLRSKQYPSLAELNDIDENARVYDLGFVIIDFIKAKWGNEAIVNLLRHNGDIHKALGISESEFETKLYAHIESAYIQNRASEK